MGRTLVPITMIAAVIAFAVAALTAGFSPYQPAWWRAAVALALLGGITPMIYAVNIRIVPVFARRPWPSEAWLRHQVILAIAGAWLVYAGWLADLAAVVGLGSAVALAGGLAFTHNLLQLFRQPPARTPAAPLPHPEQASIDAIATRFTRLSGVYLLVGLAVGLVTSWWQPATGRWDLVWAHAMLVGFFLSMAAGVCYHVMSRWTGRRWGSVAAIRLHLLLVVIGLPFMLLALMTNWKVLFAVAGPLQAAAIVLFLANLAPMVSGLPALTRSAIIGAASCLLVGVTLGAVFAIEPAIGARLRLVHAELNLFGWTGLLISGVGYYLVPRFAGHPLRWPHLAATQLAVLAGGIVLGAASLLWRAAGDGPAVLVTGSLGLVALGFLLFGLVLAGTVRGSVGTVAMVPFVPSGRDRRPAQL